MPKPMSIEKICKNCEYYDNHNGDCLMPDAPKYQPEPNFTCKCWYPDTIRFENSTSSLMPKPMSIEEVLNHLILITDDFGKGSDAVDKERNYAISTIKALIKSKLPKWRSCFCDEKVKHIYCTCGYGDYNQCLADIIKIIDEL